MMHELMLLSALSAAPRAPAGPDALAQLRRAATVAPASPWAAAEWADGPRRPQDDPLVVVGAPPELVEGGDAAPLETEAPAWRGAETPPAPPEPPRSREGESPSVWVPFQALGDSSFGAGETALLALASLPLSLVYFGADGLGVMKGFVAPSPVVIPAAVVTALASIALGLALGAIIGTAALVAGLAVAGYRAVTGNFGKKEGNS